MQTITINSEPTHGSRLTCTCGWMEKCYPKDTHGMSIDHFIRKHGGNGMLQSRNEKALSSRLVKNGRLV